MRPIQFEDIKDQASYERVRSEIRKRVIELRILRRVAVGERISIVFENRETVLYQLQEMLRTDSITEKTAILQEIETLNELLPKSGSLAGTLFVELHEPEKMRADLEAFVGLDSGDHVWFAVGEAGRVRAKFAEGQGDEGRMTGVHYVQFQFAREAAHAFRTASEPVSLIVDHPSYRASVAVEGATRRSLMEDLAEE